MRVHTSVTVDRVTDAIERQLSNLDNPGFCILCGDDAEGVEPDAQKYECESCGENGVFGAEDLLIRMIR